MPTANQNPTTIKRRAPRKAATPADYASLTFRPVKVDISGDGVSLSAWLARAKDEYTLIRIAVALLDKDDVGTAEFVQAVGAETALSIHEGLAEQQKTYEAGVKVLESACTRILGSLSRVFVVTEEGEARV